MSKGISIEVDELQNSLEKLGNTGTTSQKASEGMKNMSDLLTQPYIKIGNKYKFVNGQKTYSEKEFKDLLKENIEETCEVKDEVKPKARRVKKENHSTEHTED